MTITDINMDAHRRALAIPTPRQRNPWSCGFLHAGASVILSYNPSQSVTLSPWYASCLFYSVTNRQTNPKIKNKEIRYVQQKFLVPRSVQRLL